MHYIILDLLLIRPCFMVSNVHGNCFFDTNCSGAGGQKEIRSSFFHCGGPHFTVFPRERHCSPGQDFIYCLQYNGLVGHY